MYVLHPRTAHYCHCPKCWLLWIRMSGLDSFLLWIIYGCFHDTLAELSRVNRDNTTCTCEILRLWFFKDKHLPQSTTIAKSGIVSYPFSLMPTEWHMLNICGTKKMLCILKINQRIFKECNKVIWDEKLNLKIVVKGFHCCYSFLKSLWSLLF